MFKKNQHEVEGDLSFNQLSEQSLQEQLILAASELAAQDTVGFAKTAPEQRDVWPKVASPKLSSSKFPEHQRVPQLAIAELLRMQKLRFKVPKNKLSVAYKASSSLSKTVSQHGNHKGSATSNDFLLFPFPHNS